MMIYKYALLFTNISKSFQNNTFNALSREATLIYYPFTKGIDQDLVHAV